jgi:magnesium transporter
VLQNILPDVNSRVGDLASPAPVRLLEVETVFEALARVRTEPGKENAIYFYVTDSDNRLVGVAPVRRLLLAEPSTLIGELMVHPAISAKKSDAFGSTLAILAEQRLLALPVTDDAGRLTGVLDVSGATHALVEMERGESAAKLFQTIGIRSDRQRAVMLSSLAVGLLLACIVAGFDGALRRAGAVVFFIPAVLTVAGASAMWAVTMSLESVQWTKPKRMRLADLWTQVRSGVAGSAMAGLFVAGWLKLLPLALSVAFSLTVAVAVGLALGYSIPRLVHRWGLDPKIASGPIVTAMADVVALSCYLAASTLFV